MVAQDQEIWLKLSLNLNLNVVLGKIIVLCSQKHHQLMLVMSYAFHV